MSSAESPPRLLVNGQWADRISALDRGFALGDGLFETIAVRHGRVRCRAEHGERLLDGCHRLGLPLPDLERLQREMALCRGDEPDGTLRVTWTRGPGMRGYAPPTVVEPTCVIGWFRGVPRVPDRPLRLRWCNTRLGENPSLAGLKHLNRLEQVLARSEWSDFDIDEGVMCSAGGDVVECTSSNLFLVVDGALRTPDLSNCGVAGVMRRRVLDLAAARSIPFDVGRVTVAEVEAADEVFITNVTRGIAAVARLGDHRWPAPGARTLELQAALAGSFQ